MDVKRVIRSVSAAVFGDPHAKLLSHQEIQTPSYLVLRLEYLIDGISKELFVKLPRSREVRFQNSVRRLRAEYDITRQVRATLPSSPELDTVAPAGFVNEIHALVTWGVQGTSLQTHISSQLRFRYFRRDHALERLSELAARWLRNFHSSGLTGSNNDLRTIVSRFCGDRLDELSSTRNSQISKSLAESLKKEIVLWIDASIKNPEIEVILCHNDFSPHNILVTRTGICVLDFSFATAGLKTFDLACFWHKLEDLRKSLSHGNRGIEAIQNCFLETYGSGYDLSRPEFKLGVARVVLSKMLTLLNTRPTQPYQWIENRIRYAGYVKLLKSGFEPAKS